MGKKCFIMATFYWLFDMKFNMGYNSQWFTSFDKGCGTLLPTLLATLCQFDNNLYLWLGLCLCVRTCLRVPSSCFRSSFVLQVSTWWLHGSSVFLGHKRQVFCDSQIFKLWRHFNKTWASLGESRLPKPGLGWTESHRAAFCDKCIAKIAFSLFVFCAPFLNFFSIFADSFHCE